MSNGVLLGGLGSGSSIIGDTRYMRVKDDSKISRGDFITLDTYTEVVEGVKNISANEKLDDQGHSECYLMIDENTTVKAYIPIVGLYANSNQWTYDIKSDWYYRNIVSTYLKDQNTSLTITITRNSETKTHTITYDHWIGVPRLYKLSNNSFIVCFYSVEMAEIYNLDLLVVSFDNELNISISNIQSVLISRYYYSNDYDTSNDYSWPVWNSNAGYAYSWGFTKNPERYNIFVINDKSFYLWYGSYDMRLNYLPPYASMRKTEKFSFENGSLSYETVYNLQELDKDVEYEHLDYGRNAWFDSDVDCKLQRFWYNSKWTYTANGHYIAKRSSDGSADTAWNPGTSSSGSKIPAVTACKIDTYGDTTYYLAAYYGAFSNAIDSTDEVDKNIETSMNTLCISLVQYNSSTKTRKIQPYAIEQCYGTTTDQTKDAGSLVLKRITNSAFLLIANGLNGSRPTKILIIKPYYRNDSEDERYTIIDRNKVNKGVYEADANISTTYIKNITQDVLGSYTDVSFRTNYTNITISDKILKYEDSYQDYTSGVRILRKFYYVYKVSMMDTSTGRIIEFFLNDRNLSSAYAEIDDNISYIEAVVKAAASEDFIAGVSLQNRNSLETARVKTVSGTAIPDDYTLYKDGILYTSSTVPGAFKQAYQEALKNKLFGVELIKYISDRF